MPGYLGCSPLSDSQPLQCQEPCMYLPWYSSTIENTNRVFMKFAELLQNLTVLKWTLVFI
jgi:hypothetical protein